jgi:hypothetical protein|tara:strand:- start:284 stop:895 length:612 start_codon:yes stop_codon:yes gene_type:complete
MKINFKNIFLLILFSFLFTNFSLAKEIRTRFGFYVDLPNNFIAIQDLNVDELLKESDDNNINKDYFNEMVAGSSKNDLNIEFYFPKNLDAEINSININIQTETTVKEMLRDFKLNDICPYYKEMYESLFNKRIKQYYCKFNNDFKPKFQTVINVKHTGAVLGQLMTQYQFDLNKKLVTFTVGCEPKHCKSMEQAATNIIRSIR